MVKRLSKSKYLAGLQCQKRLWLEYNDPAKASPISRAQQRIFEQGTEVGILAQTQFPNGVLIEADPGNLNESVTATKAAIDSGVTVIFEATFLYSQTYILADIITKNGDDTWNLYEVKASTRVKEIHVQDLAVQHHVMEGAGYPISRVYVMHVNNQYVFDGGEIDLSKFFAIDEVTEAVAAEAIAVPTNLHIFHPLIQQAEVPDVLIGPHCTQPYACSFKAYCWEPYGNQAVFNIPNLGSKKKAALREQGIIFLKQLPDDYQLSAAQWAYVDRMRNYRVNIDANGIKGKLAQLNYPLHFFDFETDNPAIPRFAGTRPYQQIPFQYSCHIMSENGSVEHRDYLHLDNSDPRAPLAESLIADIGNTGSVIAYNIAFERGILQALAAAFPDYAKPVESIVTRLWDQLDIFKKHYAHTGFGNSNSIKNVLPVLVPGFSYNELAVQNGADAQADWNRMISLGDGNEKKKLIKDLKAYCKLDTEAMVEIHKVLEKIEVE